MQRGQIINQFKLTYPPNHHGILGDHLQIFDNIVKQKQVKALYLDFGHCIRIVSFASGTFSSLITLTLKNPELSSEIIHNLLSNSPNLLELSIIESASTLKNLSISGSSLKLKRLEFIDNSINFLEISAPNLVSFSLSTDNNILPRTSLNNLTLLTELSCALPARREFYALHPQLIILALTLSKTSVVEDIDNLPVLVNLKQMHVKFFLDHDEGGLLRWLLRLFEASPYLCRLSFDFGTYVPKHNFIENFSDHKFLVDLEIHNFKGIECEVEPLICIAESCSSLQKIIIHPSSYKRKVEQERVENVVKKLATRLPQKKLEIVFKAI